MFPTSTGKHEKRRVHGILIILKKSENFTQNTGKVSEFQPVLILKFFSQNIVVEVYFLNKFLYLLNYLKNTGK